MRRIFLVLTLAFSCHQLLMNPAWADPVDDALAKGTSPSISDITDQVRNSHNDWDISDTASPGMQQLLTAAMYAFKDHKPHDACDGCASSIAWYILSDSAKRGPISGTLHSIVDSIPAIFKVSSTGAAAEALDLSTAAKEVGNKGLDAVKKKLKEMWHNKPKEVYSESGTSAGCDSVLFAVWDHAASAYEIEIWGNCHCRHMVGWNPGSAGMNLNVWVVRLTGTITPAREQGQWVYDIHPKSQGFVKADCKTCGKKPKPQTATPPIGPPAGHTPPIDPGADSFPAWLAKQKAKCPGCQVILDALNELQKQRENVERDLRSIQPDIESAVSRREMTPAEAKALKIRVEQGLRAKDADLLLKMHELLDKLSECDKCPPRHASIPRPPEQPLYVGPNDKVGSGARLQGKLVSTALGIVGGLLGGHGSGSAGPTLAKCRIDDSEMTAFSDPASGVALKVGAKRDGDLVTVFATIDEAPDSGTFQTSYLENENGERQAPSDIGICKLWGEWSISVSWTKTTYVNDRMVSRESGGWSKGGEFNLPGTVSTADAPDGIWKRLGFSNASHGARQIVMRYALPAAAEPGPVDLIVHITRPEGDPVMTVPFMMRMTEGPKGFTFAPADQTSYVPVLSN